MLCKRVTRYVRENVKDMMKPLMANIARVYLMHILPLLIVAAIVETYVTPRFLGLFM